MDDLVTEFQRVFVQDLGEIVLEGKVLADILLREQAVLPEKVAPPVQLDWLLHPWKLGNVCALTFGMPSFFAQS